VLTIIGLQFSFLLAGGIIIENVFFLPGLGRLIFQAITQRDLIVVESVVMLLVFAVIVVTFLVDLAYAARRPEAAPAMMHATARSLLIGASRCLAFSSRGASQSFVWTPHDPSPARHRRQAAAAQSPRIGSAPTISAATCSRC
jgi:hypothetical protein